MENVRNINKTKFIEKMILKDLFKEHQEQISMEFVHLMQIMVFIH